MKNFKIHFSGVVLCLFEIVVGILLLINPEGFTSGIIIGAGAVMMIIGLASIIKYFVKNVDAASNGQFLMKGIIALLVGLFCAFKTSWFVETFPAMTIIYGVAVLVTGISKIQLTFDMLRRKSVKWYLALISAVIAIACAVIILRSPFESTAVLWMFTGITLIAESVLDIVTLILSGKLRKEDDDKAELPEKV